MVPSLAGLIIAAIVSLSQPVAPGIVVEGRVVDQSGLPLPGVTVRVTAVSGPATAAVVTDADGACRFELQPGRYRLESQLDGFEPVVREFDAPESRTLPDIVMSIAHFAEETTVVAAAVTEVQPAQYGAPATVANEEIINTPLKNNRYDDALPLVPNVVRGLDGLISIAGARAPQGVVLLNGVPAMDAVNGEPEAELPVVSVESVQVISTGFPAEFGRSSSGVTIVNSRSGSDRFRFSINSFDPRPRLADGTVEGFESWQPNLGIRGPLVKGRAWLAESFDYRFEKVRTRTEAGSAQDRRQHGFNSMTQFDARAGSSHVITSWLSAQQEHVEGFGLGAFTPLGTVPDSDRRVFSTAVVDRVTLDAASTLEVRLAVKRQDRTLTPQGAGAYLVAHDSARGSYFSSLDRDAESLHTSAVLSRMFTDGLGDHLVKVGVTADRARFDGTSLSRQVDYLRDDLTPAWLVSFTGNGLTAAHSLDAGVFVQDSWTVAPAVRLDLGVRADAATRVDPLVSPRAGVTWQLDGKTTVSGGGGVFADKLPLAVLAFPRTQSRIMTSFDDDGRVLSTITYRNVLADDLQRPRAWLWSAQVERHLSERWQLRMRYQERHGSHEAVVAPVTTASGQSMALLTTDGTSRSRSFETTLAYHVPTAGHQAYFSYVRGATRGNANAFDLLEGTLRTPLLLADEMAPLPVDVPHRFLAWGAISLPYHTTLSPFFELRSGFPYSPLNDDWTFAARRYSARYPVFASLDLVVVRVMKLPWVKPQARVGLKLYNIAGRRNGREVQPDIARADFGDTYNSAGRQLRGVFEIIWGGSTK